MTSARDDTRARGSDPRRSGPGNRVRLQDQARSIQSYKLDTLQVESCRRKRYLVVLGMASADPQQARNGSGDERRGPLKHFSTSTCRCLTRQQTGDSRLPFVGRVGTTGTRERAVLKNTSYSCDGWWRAGNRGCTEARSGSMIKAGFLGRHEHPWSSYASAILSVPAPRITVAQLNAPPLPLPPVSPGQTRVRQRAAASPRTQRPGGRPHAVVVHFLQRASTGSGVRKKTTPIAANARNRRLKCFIIDPFMVSET